jgi:ribose/xylose/arabinose/galactoside ABC-type transport system permease subunit
MALKIEEIPADMPPWARFLWIWFGGVIMVIAIYSACAFVTWLLVYRTRFFGHKFELSGLLHSGFLPGDTCVVRTA